MPETLRSKSKMEQQKKQLKELDTLLIQTNLYTQFLTEQMKTIAPGAGGPAGGAPEAEAGRSTPEGGTKKGRKRKAKQAPPAKKQKSTSRDFLPLMEGELRDHQVEGVKWLISLWSNGLTGILADEEGLGKTVQTIGLLSYLREKGVNGPFLVVGPVEVMPNWIREIKRFCPSLDTLQYHGTQKERREMRRTHPPRTGYGRYPKEFPVFVTTDEICMRDRKFLAEYDWMYIVVDEFHPIKFERRLISELKEIPAGNRLLLTGTPPQDYNLGELWSLLNYMYILSDLTGPADFEALFDSSGVLVVEEGKTAEMATKLRSILEPFLLRRVKADVETGPAAAAVKEEEEEVKISSLLEMAVKDEPEEEEVKIRALEGVMEAGSG